MENIKLLTKIGLINKCKELNIKGYSSKNKNELIDMIAANINLITHAPSKVEYNADAEVIEPGVPIISLHNEVATNYENTIILTNDIESKYKFIDLFCGIGGFHQALTNLKMECVYACDIDDNCRKIYETNYGLKPAGDITKIDVASIPAFDVLCGGFPCQSFSKAGHQAGFEDKRGQLFFNICDIIKHHRPKYLLLENVRNLSSHDEGNTWKVIQQNIDKLGYYTYYEPVILNALHFNIPQNRERVIIMCKRKDLGELPILPTIPTNPKALLTANIKNIINTANEENSKYKLIGKMKDVEQVWNEFIKLLVTNRISVPKFPIWTDWWDKDLSMDKQFYTKYTSWIDKNRLFYNENKVVLQKWLDKSRKCENWVGAVRKFEWQAGDLLENDGMDNVLWSARGSGIRVKRINYIPTLVAMNTVPVYGPESRTLSPRELLRLQSFPDSFIYEEKTIFKQVGNAVNVKMIEQCTRFLIHNENLF